MKNNLLMCTFFLALGYGSAATAADNVQVNITGTIVASPCKIDPANPTTIKLGDTIQAGDLAAVGSRSALINFHIKLINCPSGTSSVTATFSGTPEPSMPDWTYTNGSGTAKNVAVLLQANSSFGLGNGKTWNLPVTGGSIDYSIYTQVYSLGAAKPGTINTPVTMSFIYN